MRNFLFVVNPNAGKKIADRLIQSIKDIFLPDIEHEIVVWKQKHEFEIIRNKITSGDHTHVVAVGGDGTVNEVASVLVGTEKILGIIPVGSGNGLARTLGISTNVEAALKEIASGNSMLMDCGKVNGRFFFCTSGTGFDAHIGKLFAGSKTRGLRSYVQITLQELVSYRAKQYDIYLGEKHMARKAFLITVANAGQYGNDFYIAPNASLTDGKFNLVILRPFNPISAFVILGKIIAGKAGESSYIETYEGDKIRIVRKKTDSIHLDGEPFDEAMELSFEMLPSSIRVIKGSKYKMPENTN